MKENWIEWDNGPWLQAINEAYFGETPGIQRILRTLSAFRQKWSAKQYQYKPEALQSKELAALAKAFEDEFGFGSCAIVINNTVMVNAATIPVGMRWDEINTKKNIEVTSTGYRYKKSADYIFWLMIWGGLIYNVERYTDREVLAVLLHEVGHNFSSKNGLINNFKNIGSVLTIAGAVMAAMINPALGAGWLITSSSLFWKSINAIQQYCYRNYPQAMLVVDYIDYGFKIMGDILSEVNFLSRLSTMFLLPTHVLGYVLGSLKHKLAGFTAMGPGYLAFLLAGYPDEQFADSFPTMYGYGPDLHSAMDKLQANRGLVTQDILAKNVPLLMAAYDLCLLPVIIAITPLDEHPAIFERLMNSIRVLENEAEQTHNPRLKKRIKSDIARLNKQVEEYYTKRELTKKTMADPDRSNWFSRYYWAAMINIFGGDLRHHIADAIFDVKNSVTTKSDIEHKRLT